MIVCRIVPIVRVCKGWNAVGQQIINRWLIKARGYIEQAGGIYAVLNKSLDDVPDNISISLCQKLGANINAHKYISRNVVNPRIHDEETLLTKAVKEGESAKVKNILKLGADPCQPNIRDEFPIDLAYEIKQLEIGRILKNNGADPENRYGYVNDNLICRLASRYQHTLLINKYKKKPSLAVSFITWKSGTVFTAGIVVGGIAHELYKKWQKRKKEEMKQRQYEEYIKANNIVFE